MITSEQVRAARAMLKWSARDLADKAGVSYPTVQRLDSGSGPLGGLSSTAEKLRAALEAAGIEFIAENGGGAGVRFRERLGEP